MDRTPYRVDFFRDEDATTGAYSSSELAGIARAQRVAVRGLTPGQGQFAGGRADIIDVASGECLETIMVLD